MFSADHENNGESLARFRVSVPGKIEFYSKQMSHDEIIERRMWIRRELLNYPRWANMTNEEIDLIRVRKTGSGYLAEDPDGYDFLLPGKNTAMSEHGFRKARAMMPFEFMDLTGKDFNWNIYTAGTEKIKEVVNKYIINYERFKSNGMGLYIYSGTKGSGKTMLACCLLNEISKRYVGSVKFINILDFLEITKKGFNNRDEDIQSIYNSSLLVLDDIGVQLSREWVDTVLYRLINVRYTNKLPVIYTSNISIDKLHIDERVIDRIESTTYPVNLPEEGIRKQQRQQHKNKLMDEIERPIESGNSLQGKAQPEPYQKTRL